MTGAKGTTKTPQRATKKAVVTVYKLVRPKAPKEKFYRSRRLYEPMKFTIGKAIKVAAGADIFVYRSIYGLLAHHEDIEGGGPWTVLSCETDSVAGSSGYMGSVRTLKPVKDLGSFFSGGLREKERWAIIKKVRTEADFVKAAKTSGRRKA